jgi:molybdate transport system ATP-binding protein
VRIIARFLVNRADFTLNVSLDLPGRGIVSLFGPSGCGKTTILRALAGLDRHRDGYLTVGDMTWQDENTFLPSHHRPVGYVFQESSLFPHLNVRRNLEYGQKRTPARERKIPLEQAIELLDIEPLLERQPGTLSGGERQRVAIARALAVSPSLLLMDEPLAALDLNRKREILPYIASLPRQLDIPVIHVSHSPEEVARLADHLVLMQSGSVVEAGEVHEMFTRLDLPLALDEEAAAVFEATVSEHDEEFHMTCLEFSGGRVVIPREDLQPGQRVRLRLAARDVSLTLERQSGTSILNILDAVVDEVTDESAAQVTVRLLAGKAPLLARITRKSAVELELKPGKAVYAQVKSVALLN